MKHLLLELNQVHAVLVAVAPERAGLVDLMERLCVELTTEILNRDQRAHLVNWSSNREATGVTTWTSFTLGRRSGCDARVTVLGFDLEHAFPSPAVFELADALMIFNSQSSERSEAFLGFKPILTLQPKPVVVLHREAPIKDLDLREKALKLWASRNFDNCMHLSDAPGFLQKSLDWIFHF